jgi:hypothetical protein
MDHGAQEPAHNAPEDRRLVGKVAPNSDNRPAEPLKQDNDGDPLFGRLLGDLILDCDGVHQALRGGRGIDQLDRRSSP